MRRTKIIATLGPASQDPDVIRQMVDAGLDVARLNFSHGDHAVHERNLASVRQASKDAGRPVAVLQDIQGPKIRLGTFPNGPRNVVVDEVVELTPAKAPTDDAIPCVYPGLIDEVKEGERVVLADGLVFLRVEGVKDDRLIARVETGGTLSDRKGVAFPDSRLTVDSVTPKDEVDLAFGREIGVDFVAASFVRSGDDVQRVSELSGGVPIIAKIELVSAYENLDEILDHAEGAMVARGDLGVQMPLQTLPGVQRDIIHRTNRRGRTSITATEMLESMTNSPRPTRAEVTDVTYAINQGTDAVMLSGETAIGKYPVRVIETMAAICSEADEELGQQDISFLTESAQFASAMARATVEIANDMGLRTIVAFTESGTTAALLSKYRPAAQIVAFTPVPEVYRRMALLRSVHPLMFDRRDTTDRMLSAAEKTLEKVGIAEPDEAVVMVAGIPPNVQASTNIVKLHTIGERNRRHGQHLSPE